MKELHDYLGTLRIILVIDNLETLSFDGLRPELLSDVPSGSKVVITSRVGLGEIELRYKLDPFDKKQSISLARKFAKSLNLNMLVSASEERLERYCRLLFFNPLLIKWFVASVAAGADPDRLLTKGNQAFAQALQYCFENLFTRLSASEQEILHILAAARRPLTQAELYYLLQETTSLEQDKLESTLNTLHNSSMLKRTLGDSRRLESGTNVQLTDVAAEYIARFAPPPSKLFEHTQMALKKLREMTERSAVQEAAYKYDMFAVRAETRDERISAVYLNTALQQLKAQNVPGARLSVERAKTLLPTYSEVYRISALVESRGNDLYRAAEQIETAISLAPSSALPRYQYAIFLLNEMQDSQQALAQIEGALKLDPNDDTIQTAYALALTRLGEFKHASELYEQLLPSLGGRPRKWRIITRDQAAECYRRWAEQDRTLREGSLQRDHLNTALEILEEGFAASDFDHRVGIFFVNIVEDASGVALHSLDSPYALRLLGRLRDASFVVECPPFRTLSFERFGEYSRGGPGFHRDSC